jgi:hypothetical protein
MEISRFPVPSVDEMLADLAERVRQIADKTREPHMVRSAHHERAS